jgi:hypothetical protein
MQPSCPGSRDLNWTGKGLKWKASLLGLFDTEDHWRLLVSLPLHEVPSFISRGAAHQQAWALSASEGRNYAYLNLASKFLIYERTRFFYRSFTSPPKEGMLRTFFSLKNLTASVGSEPAIMGTRGQHAIARSERDDYCAETSFHLWVKRSSPFESAGVSAHTAARMQGGSIWASYDLPLPFQ